MRIAIVNDSAMAVESLRRVIMSVPEYSLAWIANDGAEAIWRCSGDVPDLILMDLIMPVIDGVEATRKIMADTPCAILVVTSTVGGNAAKVFKAMGYGALDAVNTPVLGVSGDAQGKDEFLAKIGTIARLIRPRKGAIPGLGARPSVAAVGGSGKCLVAIGSSSGGPKALAELLRELPSDFPAPIVIVQHVDEKFVAELALWLDRQCPLKVRLAQKGDSLAAGTVLVAGSNNHLIIKGDGRLDYTPDPVELAYRPSVDVFFASMAANWDGDAAALLLTGMGRDGAEGLLALRNKGVYTLAQDEASSAVYGMPKAAAQIGAAEKILPLDDMAHELLEYFSVTKTRRERKWI